MKNTTDNLDIKVNNGFWQRFVGWFAGGRLQSPKTGSQTGPVSAIGRVGHSDLSDVRALQISTVFSCVRLITTVISCLPLDVYEGDGDDRKKLNLNNTLVNVLKINPNAYMTAVEFREAMTMQLCFYGNAYALAERNVVGDIISLIPLQSTKMDVRVENNKIIYRYYDDGRYADFTKEEIFHIKGFGYTGLVGLSPIAFAASTAATAVAMEDQQKDFYNNGAKSPQILMTDRLLNAEQRTQLETNFKEIASGPVSKRLWILEANMKTVPIGVSAQDAETMAARKFQVSEIARFFGVPPHLVGDVEKTTSWGSGIEQLNIGFLQYTLNPYLVRWEQAINRWLVRTGEIGKIKAEHNIDGLLRGDSASRAAFITAMVNNGVWTINEARRLENKPPIPGGDVATRQSQNVPLTELGK